LIGELKTQCSLLKKETPNKKTKRQPTHNRGKIQAPYNAALVSKTNDRITRTMAIRTKRKMMKPFRLIFLWFYCIMV
jgi:hypothetical protein